MWPALATSRHLLETTVSQKEQFKWLLLQDTLLRNTGIIILIIVVVVMITLIIMVIVVVVVIAAVIIIIIIIVMITIMIVAVMIKNNDRNRVVVGFMKKLCNGKRQFNDNNNHSCKSTCLVDCNGRKRQSVDACLVNVEERQ